MSFEAQKECQFVPLWPSIIAARDTTDLAVNINVYHVSKGR